MPKEKNSAACAICPAVSAARGTSIIVPISVCTEVPVAAATSASTFSASSRAASSSWTAPTSGIMISGRGLPPAFTRSDRCFRDGPHLHLVQAGDDQAETNAAQAEHRVLLMQAAHRLQQLVVLLGRVVAGQCDLDRELGQVRQELVQRRVEQPDRGRQPVHGLEDFHEVAALQWLKTIQRGLPGRVVIGQDEPLDELPPLTQEHVLGAAQPDALRAETHRALRVLAVVGVGPDAEPALGVRVRHQPVHGRDQLV